MRSVAVAVNGSSSAGRGSRRAVQWAVENLMPQADRFILVHVMPRIASIPTPSGECIPIMDLEANVAAAYIQDVKEKFEQIFIPFKKLCKASTVETSLLEDDNPATALLRYIYIYIRIRDSNISVGNRLSKFYNKETKRSRDTNDCSRMCS